MSGSTSKKITGPWSPEDSYSVCLQAMHQLITTKVVNTDLIKVEGRTDRAIFERFAIIKKSAAAEAAKVAAKVANAGTTSSSAPPVQQTTPGNKRGKGKEAGEGTTSASKRKATPKKNTPKKKLKAEQDSEESEGEMSSLRSETDLDTISNEGTDIDDQ